MLHGFVMSGNHSVAEVTQKIKINIDPKSCKANFATMIWIQNRNQVMSGFQERGRVVQVVTDPWHKHWTHFGSFHL